jgi:hypothetical protein
VDGQIRYNATDRLISTNYPDGTTEESAYPQLVQRPTKAKLALSAEALLGDTMNREDIDVETRCQAILRRKRDDLSI